MQQLNGGGEDAIRILNKVAAGKVRKTDAAETHTFMCISIISHRVLKLMGEDISRRRHSSFTLQ